MTELEMIGQMAVEIRKLREELAQQEKLCQEQRRKLAEYEQEVIRRDRAALAVFAAASTGGMRRKLQWVYEAAMGDQQKGVAR